MQRFFYWLDILTLIVEFEKFYEMVGMLDPRLVLFT